jgi:hypothetical protein
VLPREEVKSERAVAAAAYGTAAHTWVETGVAPEGKDGDAVLRKVKASGIKREDWWPTTGLHEVPLAYNVVTGESLALVLGLSTADKNAWKMAFGDEWVVGTADYVGVLMEAPWVDDLKTGRNAEWEHHRFQQTLYVLAWNLFATHKLEPTRSTITHWPKYPLPKMPLRFGEVLEPDYLEDFQRKLKNLRTDVLRLREAKEKGMDVHNRLTDGPQCVYCPSKNSCTKGMKYE